MPYASYTELKKTLEKVIGQMQAEQDELQRFAISRNFRNNVDAFVGTHFSIGGVASFGLRDFQKKRWQPGTNNDYASFTIELDELLVYQFANASQWLDKFVAATIACRPTYSGKVFRAAAAGDFRYLTHGGGQSATSIAEAGDLVGFPSKDDGGKKIVHTKFVATWNATTTSLQKDHLKYVLETLEREYTPDA